MKSIVGWTSKQEAHAGVWYSKGEITTYQIAMHIFEDKATAQKIYGEEAVRKVRVRLNEVREK